MAGTTTRIDVSPAPDLTFEGVPLYTGLYDITADGKYVVFVEDLQVDRPTPTSPCDATGREALYSYDIATGSLQQLSPFDGPYGAQYGLVPVLASDADQVAWEGWDSVAEGPSEFNLWLTDLATGQTRPLLSWSNGKPCTSASTVTADGFTCSASVALDGISADGSTVAAETCGDDVAFSGPSLTSSQCAELFLNTTTGAATELTTPDGSPARIDMPFAMEHAVSETGRYVMFNDAGTQWGLATKQYVTMQLDRRTGKVLEMPYNASKAAVFDYSETQQFAIVTVPSGNARGYQTDLYDMVDHSYMPIGLLPDGDLPPDASQYARISPNGDYLAYQSFGDYGYNTPTSFESYLQNVPGSPSTGLTATGGDQQVALAWRNPRQATRVVVRRSTNATAPACATCGLKLAAGHLTKVTASRLTNGRRYGFAVFSYDKAGRLISRKTAQGAAHRPWPARLSTQTAPQYDRSKTTVFGTLTRAATVEGLSGRHVTVLVRATGTSKWRTLQRVTTDRYGAWKVTVPTHKKRQYKARFDGDRSYRAASSATVTLGS